MKTHILKLVILFSCSFLQVSHAQIQWQRLASGTAVDLNAVKFTDCNTGYIAGNAGTILKTINGGDAWISQVTGTSRNLNAVTFTSNSTGYAVGDGGTILKTINAGEAWTSLVSGTSVKLNAAYFTDVTTGYVVGDGGTILKTNDAGTTWIRQNTSLDKTLSSVYFINSTTGYAAGREGVLLKTETAGSSWALQNSGTVNDIQSIYFKDALNGYRVVTTQLTNILQNPLGALSLTTDGGNLWKDQIFPNVLSLNAINFNNKTGYVVGNTGVVLATNDGGITWAIDATGSLADFKAVDNPCSTVIYIVGKGGTILKKIARRTKGLNANDFKIGMFGFGGYTQKSQWYGDIETNTLNSSGNYSSQFNVLAQDGFNAVHAYLPDFWMPSSGMQKLLTLAKNNNMQMLVSGGNYFHLDPNNNPANGGHPGVGYNDYNQSSGTATTNQDYLMDNVYNQADLADVVWGYQVTEEASWYHSCPIITTGPSHWCDCDDAEFRRIELPAPAVSQALGHYRSKLNQNGIGYQKLMIMEANHHHIIWDGGNDGGGGEGIYYAQDYIKQANKPDVFFEGSYVGFPAHGDAWRGNVYYENGSRFHNNWDYLGPHKSIDYAKSLGLDVHDVIFSGLATDHNTSIEFYNPSTKFGSIYSYVSDANIRNANWLWFQTYTSIIHGAKGVWFWEMGDMYKYDEQTLKTYVGNNNNTDRFQDSKFPEYYRNYLKYLATELRYLINNNLISTDPANVIYTKTDQPDQNCILPSSSSYIPLFIVPSNMRGEEYGLRYSIRTNGTDIIMIVTNPLPVSVSTSFSFNNVSNPIIKNSDRVDVIFESAGNPSSNTYKTNRNGGVNLTNNTVSNRRTINFSNHSFGDTFGPLDVHVYVFKSTAPVANYNNGWDKKWTNNGSGWIGGWRVGPGQKFYPGDFDGDGVQELLCVAADNVRGWMTILKYNDASSSWDWVWSNYGNESAGGGIYPYRKDLIVGDFNGDGKDEVLGEGGGASNSWVTMFNYSNGDWHWMWSNYGNPSGGDGISPYGYNLTAGDFDGDGRDEVISAGVPNNSPRVWITMFKYTGGTFHWMWSNYGNESAGGGIYPYRYNLKRIDVDGNGKDELLGLSSWATTFTFSNNDWHWSWSTYGANSFGGWGYPLNATDKLLIGSIDPDNKDELLFIQRASNGAWATSEDFSASNQPQWNWSTYGTPPYIDDWDIRTTSGDNTDYLLLKAVSGKPKNLLAFRKTCNNYLVNMYYTTSAGNYRLADNEPDNNSGALDNIKKDPAFIIFPNPNKGSFTIQYGALKAEQTIVKVNNIFGQTLKTVTLNTIAGINEYTLSIDELSAGMYIVQVENDQGIQVKKIEKID